MNKHLSESQIKRAIKFQHENNCKKLDEKIGTIQCNICGYESEYEFLPFGNPKQPRYEKCPNCDSIKRGRLLWYVIENYTDYFKQNNIKILHTSPQPALYNQLKHKYADNYISSNIEKKAYIDEIVDLQNIKYPDNTFDLILSKHVLEHIPDYPKALREIYRVLKPGGMIIFLIPTKNIEKTFEFPQINTPTLRARYYRQDDHLRYFSVENVYKDLEDTGFNIIRDTEKKIKKEDMIHFNFIEEPVFIAIKPEKPKKNIKNIEPETEINLQTHENYCSLCENENPEKFKYDNKEKKDKICLKCNSNGDDRLIYNEIYFDVNENSIILNPNSSKAMEKRLGNLKNYNKNIPEKGFIQKAKLKTTNNKYQDKLQKIKDESIDIIISNHFLDRCEDDYEILQQFNRILKPDGKLIIKETTDLDLDYKIETPEYKSKPNRNFFLGNPNAIRCYGKDLLIMCQLTGFNVKYDDPETQVNNLQSMASYVVKAPLIICTKN